MGAAAGGRVAWAALALREAPFVLPHFRPEYALDGAMLERRTDGSVSTHTRHEIGVGRLSPVAPERAPSLREAVERDVASLDRDGRGIDGVPVDWRA